MSFKVTDDWQVALTWLVQPTGRAWQRAAGAALTRSGLPLAAAAALLTIERLGDGVRQKDVAEEAAIDPAAIARSINQLEKEGMVNRETDARDARAKTLHLTPAGRDVAARLNTALNEVRKTILAGISDKDGQAVVRVLLNLEAASNAYSSQE